MHVCVPASRLKILPIPGSSSLLVYRLSTVFCTEDNRGYLGSEARWHLIILFKKSAHGVLQY